MSGSELERIEPLFDVEGPWDPIPGEAPSEHALFALYRDGGRERSIKRLVETTGVTGTQLREIARRQSWGARVAEFDQYQQLVAQREVEGDQMKMRKRHADAAAEIFEKAQVAVQLLNPMLINPRDIAPMLDVAARLERLSRGIQDGKQVTVSGKIEVDVAGGLSAEERRELLAKIVDQLESRNEIVEAEIVEGADDDGA